MTKKLFLTAIMFFSILMVTFASQSVFAADVDLFGPGVCDVEGGGTPEICNVEDVNKNASDNVLIGPNGIITRLAQWLVWASGTIALVLIIIAGLMFIFSSGNAESAGRARNTVIYAIIGLVIAVVGQAIVSFVLNRL